MNRFLILPLALAFGLSLAACAPADETQQRSQRGPLLQAEIAEAAISGSALTAVQRLRPQWLSRAGQAVVYIDESRAGGTGALNTVPIQHVVRIERLNAGEATTRFGTGHPQGAFLVYTR